MATIKKMGRWYPGNKNEGEGTRLEWNSLHAHLSARESPDDAQHQPKTSHRPTWGCDGGECGICMAKRNHAACACWLYGNVVNAVHCTTDLAYIPNGLIWHVSKNEERRLALSYIWNATTIDIANTAIRNMGYRRNA